MSYLTSGRPLKSEFGLDRNPPQGCVLMGFLCVHTPLTQHGCPLVFTSFMLFDGGLYNRRLCVSRRNQKGKVEQAKGDLIKLKRGNVDVLMAKYMFLYLFYRDLSTSFKVKR